MLDNVLLKVSANDKFPWVDGFSLFSNSIFRSTLSIFTFFWITPFDESVFKIF